MNRYDVGEDRPERDREAEAARARAAKRPAKPRRCEVCGIRKEMAANGRYCGQVCRNRAYRERKQARTPLALAKQIVSAVDAKRCARAMEMLQTLITMLEKV